MDEIKLATNERISIEDGASLGSIDHIASTDSDAVAVCAKLTDMAVSHVEFLHDGTLSGVYDNCVMDNPPTRTTNEDTTVTVHFSLREKSAVEIRLDTVEGAIEDIGEAVSALTEG